MISHGVRCYQAGFRSIIARESRGCEPPCPSRVAFRQRVEPRVPRLQHNYAMTTHAAKGVTVDEVAAIVRDSGETVRLWVHRHEVLGAQQPQHGIPLALLGHAPTATGVNRVYNRSRVRRHHPCWETVRQRVVSSNRGRTRRRSHVRGEAWSRASPLASGRTGLRSTLALGCPEQRAGRGASRSPQAIEALHIRPRQARPTAPPSPRSD